MHKQSLQIGSIALANTVLLAPMAGVSDLPFRRLVSRLGAGLVFSEMLACKQFVDARADVLKRAERGEIAPFAIQLSGREAYWMGEAAMRAEQMGAQIIDINMGCPAKQVTKGYSGSALMRDLDHALTLIDAVIAAVRVPVTLKMRLGWDRTTLNAPQLAQRAEQAGIQMVTVHGRTRSEFFTGQADWQAVARVKAAVDIPVIVNGDITSEQKARESLALSGADGVMIGRGAMGAPWLPGLIVRALDRQTPDGVDGQARAPVSAPSLSQRADYAIAHYQDVLHHYGSALGTRKGRKHLAQYVAQSAQNKMQEKKWRKIICQEDNPKLVSKALGGFYAEQMDLAA